MTKLIDADALLEVVRQYEIKSKTYYVILDLITNAPTVERGGWVSAEELQKVYDDMFSHKDIARVAQSLWNLIHAK